MKAVVPIKDIMPNPFQARKHIDPQAVKSLAEEIREVGLWPGSLRGRMRNGKVELCYGHRRLRAVKLLGWRDVEIEIADLSDDQMSMQGLAENMQREGLSDIEKAEAIVLLMKRMTLRGVSENEAMQKISRLLGLGTGWMKDLLSLLDMEPQVQKAVRDRSIAGRTALEAHRFGGKEMVATAIKHKMPVHKISAIAQKIRRIPSPELREQLRKNVIQGKITDPEALEQKAQKFLKSHKMSVPSNLNEMLADWGRRLDEWSDKLGELSLYRKYLRNSPAGHGVQKKVNALIKRLSKIA